MNSDRPTIGVIFHPRFPPEKLADYARRAESAGFDELWLWDDCFLPGAFTSAAIALSATQRLKVGIGLLPATAYNPLFAAMEITTLAQAFPNRILPGFGHGVGSWMAQIGAAPTSSMKALQETVIAVRQLLAGELVTTQGEQVKLDKVQMQVVAEAVPPLYVGAMREKSLQLAGRVGDGTILTAMSSPAYVRWAQTHIRTGMAEAGRSHHRLVVYLDVKVNRDGELARATMRRSLAGRLPWADVQVEVLGIAREVAALIEAYGGGEIAEHIPDDWVDVFGAAGTPEQVTEIVQRLVMAGADSIVFQPLDGDPDCLDEYINYGLPRLVTQI
ncbi:MAG: F420-dependent glucose-6-phosphate dehydrogenase [Anaerolineae bacterium]|nr:F420-dependent glucose-6-phosphate dehydrogenase [Anaerolineae bacterium]